MKVCFVLVIVFLSSLFSAVPFCDSKDDTGFSMFRGNPQLSGVLSNTTLVETLSGVKFTFVTNGAIRSMPAADKGVVYFGSTDNNLYAVDAKTGQELWRFKTDGAVNSNPAIANAVVYFASRDGFVYALSIPKHGKQLWRFKMQQELPFDQGFDYYLSSPNVVDQVLYIGSGDGNLYALKASNGDVLWQYGAGARIRTTPAVVNDSVIFGTLSGVIYSVKKQSGALSWKFETKGASLKFEEVGYDQTSIICSPAVNERAVYVGGRDGFLYAIDLPTGKEIWKVSHDGSWILAAAVDQESVYISSGSAAMIQAVDINSGREKWRFKANGAVYASPILVGDVLYSADYGGNLFALDKKNGTLKWSFPMGLKVFSSPLVYGGTVYGASDKGVLFALEGSNSEVAPPVKARRIVYWQGSRSAHEYNSFQEGAGITIRDYFKNVGYEVADATTIEGIVKELIAGKTTSVIVFADNKFPKVLVDPLSENALIRKYLDAGGKVALLGANPLGIRRNHETGDFEDIDFEPVTKVFGVKLYDRKWMNVGSVYSSRPTEEGTRWGLRGSWVGAGEIDSNQVTTVLAKNEHGFATSWLKSYGGTKGTGLLQLCLPVGSHAELAGDFLSSIQAAVDYGITW